MKRRVTETEVDREMVKRRLMHPVSGGFEGDKMRKWLTPITG